MELKSGEITIFRGEALTVRATAITSDCSLVSLEDVNTLEVILPGTSHSVTIDLTDGAVITNELGGKFSFRITEAVSQSLRVQARQDFFVNVVFTNGDIRTIQFNRALTVRDIKTW